MIYCKCIYRHTHSIHCRNICFPGPLSPTPGSLHAMVSKLDYYKHHHHDWEREKPFTYHRIMCTISIHSKKGGDHGGAGTDMHGGHTRTHPHPSLSTSLVCWLQQLLYYLSLCARVSDLPLLSCQDHHFSRDDLDGSDWHRHFWTPHLHGRGHRNLGRPCFPELSGFTM